MVYPRPRTTRRDQVNFKVRSVLNKTEHEGRSYSLVAPRRIHLRFLVARHDLVPWLQERIAEQKRIDATTSGAERALQDSTPLSPAPPSARDVQLLLPGDSKKGKAGPKQLFSERGLIRPHSQRTERLMIAQLSRSRSRSKKRCGLA